MAQKEITFVSKTQLTDQELEVCAAVGSALWGIRHDLELADVIQMVIDMYENGYAWDVIGSAATGATKAEGVH